MSMHVNKADKGVITSRMECLLLKSDCTTRCSTRILHNFFVVLTFYIIQENVLIMRLLMHYSNQNEPIFTITQESAFEENILSDSNKIIAVWHNF